MFLAEIKHAHAFGLACWERVSARFRLVWSLERRRSLSNVVSSEARTRLHKFLSFEQGIIIMGSRMRRKHEAHGPFFSLMVFHAQNEEIFRVAHQRL